MIPRVRGVLLACAGLLAVFAGWRIVGQMQAERHAASAPARALDWRPQHPRALQARAALQMRAGDSAGAAATARQLLAHEPLQGQAFRLVGEAALAAGDLRQALRLHERAAPASEATIGFSIPLAFISFLISTMLRANTIGGVTMVCQ